MTRRSASTVTKTLLISFQINALRYTMDSILHTGEGQTDPKFGDASIQKLKLQVKQYIIK